MTELANKKPLSLGAMVAAACLGGLSIATSASADPVQAFGSIDADKNGWISEQEFLTAVEPTTVMTMHRSGERARFISKYEARRLLRKEYKAYDENGDGRVDAREFSPRYDVTSRVSFYLLDQNSDGEVRLDELLEFTAGARGETERLEAVFSMLDSNQNGAITLKEYQIISS